MSLLISAFSRVLVRPAMASVFEQQFYFRATSFRLKSGIKTNSGAKKRFRLRGSGSIKRFRSGKSHNTGYKTRARVNRLGSSTGVEGKKIEDRVRKLLGCF